MVLEDEWSDPTDDSASGEEVSDADDPAIFAVQTRLQRRKELQRIADDDAASAQSGASPMPLAEIQHPPIPKPRRARSTEVTSTTTKPTPRPRRSKPTPHPTIPDDTSVPEDLAALDSSLFLAGKDKSLLSRAEKRAQARARFQMKSSTLLSAMDSQQFQQAQKEDSSLQPLWESAEVAEGAYLIMNGLLCRKGRDEWADEIVRPVVPMKFRQEVLQRAHGDPLAAHLGTKKSVACLLQSFYWPGAHRDMQEFRQHCIECQKAAKRSVKKAPLFPLPVIDEPFRRIAVDLLRRTARGHRYILTVMDYATRYPEAVPLRRIDVETVAEALCVVFTRFGIPTEILTDQGSQFTSGIMQQVLQLLEVTHIRTSPYHPQTDGMVERFHATMKAMLLKKDNPSKEWDRLLPYICFAYRSVPHDVTGYSPFALMFGREVQSPLTLLRRQLTGDNAEEVPVADFVDNLRDKLRLTWEHASDLETMAKHKSKLHHDKTAQLRAFQPGDSVLVFEPGPHKLDVQWAGPYNILKKVTDVTYLVATPDRQKKQRLFHVNGLWHWEEPVSIYSVQFCDEETGVGSEPCLHPFERGSEGLPNISEDLPEDKRAQLLDLVHRHQKVFDSTPGETHLLEHSIPTGDHKPIAVPPRRIPQAWVQQVKEEVHEMLAAGVVEPSTSPWTFPIVPVRKKDGTVRLCVDYRPLNKVTEDDVYQMPRVDDLVERIGKANFISALDLSKGYYQVAVRPEDRAKTAFTSPVGKFQFTKMPFGLKGAPSTFQRLMDTVLASCSESFLQHTLTISLSSVLLGRTTWYNLSRSYDCWRMLASPKCFLACASCSYLGHKVASGFGRSKDCCHSGL